MEELLEALFSEDINTQEETFNSILELLRALSRKHDGENGSLQQADPFPNDFLLVLTTRLFSENCRSCAALDLLLIKAMAAFVDVYFYTLRNLSKILTGNVAQTSVERIFKILLKTPVPGLTDLETGDSLVQHQANATYRRPGLLRSEFSSCWLVLVPKLSNSSRKRFLVAIGSRVLPHMSNPQLLSTFLFDNYKQGGLLGALALDGLFTLMREYNMDFPEFYDYLYRLLDDKVFVSSYRTRFLKMLNLFMSSTMLPAYVVAAFIKKIACICLSSSPPVIIWAVSLIYNLLWKYPSCRVLIHRDVPVTWTDPYDPLETLSGSLAMESSLWELDALKQHWWPKISRLSALFAEKFSKPPFDLDSIADEICEFGYYSNGQDELSHRWRKRPATHLTIPEELF